MEGLTNLGSTCAINSLIQILYRIDKFKQIILTSSTPENTFTFELKDLFNAMETNKNSITPYRFINKFYEIFKGIFRQHEQIDICELFFLLINKIHEETATDIIIDNTFSNITQEHNYVIARHNNFKISNVYKLFQGSHMHYIRCLNCDNVSRTFEPFIIIDLDINSQSSISELISRHYSTESRNNDDYTCDRCKTKSKYDKSISIWKYPDVLFLSINRFKDINTKNIDQIKIDMRLFLNKIYSLHSIGYHHGSLNSGHYNSMCKNANNNYFLYDDNNVIPINNIEPLLNTSNSYILCYD
jgi:ubiquitin carboxyl-terminal hydrolase 36/42